MSSRNSFRFSAFLLLAVASGARAAGPSNQEYTLSYVVGAPTSGTHDFIQNWSFAGIGLEFGHYVQKSLSLGVSLRWQRYYQHDDRSTVTTADGAVTGEQVKVLNVFPLLARAKYDFAEEGAVPFIALNLGPYYGERFRQAGNLSFDKFGWQFGLAPEVGVYWRALYGDTGAQLSIRYDAGFGTDAFPAYSAFTFALGARQAL